MNHFFLCNNPLYKLPETVVSYLYHYDLPRFFVAVHKLDVNKSIKPFTLLHNNIVFWYITQNEEPQLYFIAVYDNINRIGEKKLAPKLLDAVNFFVRCLNVKHDTKGRYMLLQDYSMLIPGFQILELPQGMFMATSHMGMAICENEDTMFEFAKEKLGYNDVLLAEGTINVIVSGKEILQARPSS